MVDLNWVVWMKWMVGLQSGIFFVGEGCPLKGAIISLQLAKELGNFSTFSAPKM